MLLDLDKVYAIDNTRWQKHLEQGNRKNMKQLVPDNNAGKQSGQCSIYIVGL